MTEGVTTVPFHLSYYLDLSIDNNTLLAINNFHGQMFISKKKRSDQVLTDVTTIDLMVLIIAMLQLKCLLNDKVGVKNVQAVGNKIDDLARWSVRQKQNTGLIQDLLWRWVAGVIQVKNVHWFILIFRISCFWYKE